MYCRSTIRISITRLKQFHVRPLVTPLVAINHKNLDYEIETCDTVQLSEIEPLRSTIRISITRLKTMSKISFRYLIELTIDQP